MKKALLALAAVLVVAAVGVGVWVAVGDGGDAEARGTCEGRSYELSVEDDDGGVEASFELQSAGPGEVWEVELSQGDTSLLSTERTTDEDGELDVDAYGQESGSGEFVATATPADGSAACTATVQR